MFCGHIFGRMPVKSNRWIFPSKLFLTSIRASLNGFGNITLSKTDLITKPPTPVLLLKDKHIYIQHSFTCLQNHQIPSLQKAYITDLITRSPAAKLSSAELDYIKYFCTNPPPSLLRYIQIDRPTNSRACSAALTPTQGNTDRALAQRNSTGPKEARTQHWPKGSTDTTLAQRKHRHSTGPKETQTQHWPKGSTDTALAQRKHGHSTGPKEAWTQHRPKGSMDRVLAQRNHWPKGTAPALRKHGYSTGPKEALAQRKHRRITGPEEVWTQHWPKGSTDTSLAQRKYGHSTGPKEAQTHHWPRGSMDTALAQRKHRHSTGPKEGQHWPKGRTALAQRKHRQHWPKGAMLWKSSQALKRSWYR